MPRQRSDNLWFPADGAAPAAIDAVVAASTVPLPDAYLDFLMRCNGGHGSLAIEPRYVQMWPAEELWEHNRGYQVAEFLPGFIGFASNGGGEMFAFDVRRGPPYPVVMVPFIVMAVEDAIVVAPDFKTSHHLGRRSGVV